VFTGCSGGSLTTAKKALGLAQSVVRQPAASSAQPSAILELELPSVAPWD